MSPYYSNLRKAVGKSLLMMPAVAAVVHNSKGELLLQEKSDGTWSLPAGAIEPGETPLEAVRRELLEETGIEADEVILIGSYGGSEFCRIPSGAFQMCRFSSKFSKPRSRDTKPPILF